MKQIICEFGKCTLVNGKTDFAVQDGFKGTFDQYNVVEKQQKNMMKRQKEFLG